MQYCAHVFIGNEFQAFIENSFSIFCKYNSKTYNYTKIYNLAESGSSFELKEYKVVSDASAELFEFAWELVGNVKSTEIQQLWSEKVFDKILTVDVARGQNTLPVIIHSSLSKREHFKTIKTLCKGLNSQSVVDFIGYAQDMMTFVDVNSNKTKDEKIDVVSEIKSTYKELNYSPVHNHFIVLQNRTENGIAIFNEEVGAQALYNMIAHIYMLMSSHYESIFCPQYKYLDVIGVGFASIYFDEYMFVDYMLRNVMLQAIDNQSVNNNNVDINVAGNLSESILKDKKTVLSQFLEKYSGGDKDAPNYDEIKDSIEQIYDRVLGYFNNQLNTDMTAKAALLAAMLSQTECELFSSSVYNPSLSSIEDLYDEVINYYVKEDDVAFYAVGDDKLVNPIKEIKDVNRKLIQSEVNIRTIKEQLGGLEDQIDKNDNVKKCVIDNEGFFSFDDKKYRLLPNDIEEPLQETYQEHEVKIKSIDLRSKFSSIKDQGQQGSCLSFTLTSIFEYMMKLNMQEDCDLSEAFLYYNARYLDQAGDVNVNVDNGSRFKPSMDSLTKYGIALEKYWPYSEGAYSTKPTEEAYKDAESRKLIKALNVNKTSDAIKSALSDGYPVAACFTLCPSFYSAGAYISMPTDEEFEALKNGENPETKHSSHAMAIVGFSDEMKMFLVRNSWGVNWGDKGYCYIPYAYIDTPELFTYACIITEVASLEVKKTELKEFPALKINNDDLYIRYIIAKADYEYQLKEIENLKKERIRLVEYFELQKRLYSDPNQRDRFIDDNVAEINEEIAKQKQDIREFDDKIEKIGKAFDKFKKNLLIKTSIVIVSIIAVICLWNYIWDGDILPLFKDVPIKYSVASKIGLSLSSPWWLPVILCALYLLYAYIRFKKEYNLWREENRDLESSIRELKRDIDKKLKRISLFRHKTFAAWKLITTLENVQTKLQKTYTNILNLINNLRTWYKEIKDNSEEVSFNLPVPYISVLDKAKLDKFFEEKVKESSICEIDLCKNISQHTIDADYLSTFKKQMRQELKAALVKKLEDIEFSITAHVADNSFSSIAVDIDTEFIRNLMHQSKMFLHIQSTNTDRAIINTSDLIFAPDIDKWQGKLSRKFNGIYPEYIKSEDKYRITLMRMVPLYFSECVIFASNKDLKK